MDRRLCVVDRLAQLGHRLSCGPCRKSAAQMKRIDAVAKSIPPESPVPMPEDARKRIASQMVTSLTQLKESSLNQSSRRK